MKKDHGGRTTVSILRQFCPTLFSSVGGSVADPDHIDTDPNPAFHFEMYPDLNFHFDTDPDPYCFKELM
jgi:hypothetical protein